jgi:hypothetical protein
MIRHSQTVIQFKGGKPQSRESAQAVRDLLPAPREQGTLHRAIRQDRHEQRVFFEEHRKGPGAAYFSNDVPTRIAARAREKAVTDMAVKMRKQSFGRMSFHQALTAAHEELSAKEQRAKEAAAKKAKGKSNG